MSDLHELPEPEFENEVRRIARSLWPSAQYQGASMIDNRERDGVFITDECVHLIECTVSRREDKAKEDIRKLTVLSETIKNRFSDRAVKCWFITLDEPTADQRKIASRHTNLVVALSINQFRSKLIDANAYIECRKNYRFGSMQDFERVGKKEFRFTELDILDDAGNRHSIAELVEDLIVGKRFVFLGDYGAGKSTSMRELFINLQAKFMKNKIAKFPVLLNLRDHYSQTNPAEALERHARNVGYASPSHLVKAWLAGYAVILLDGFDELATAGWTGQAAKLKKLRYDSMQLLREFVRNTPEGCGIAVSGRRNYFDSAQELQKSLGIDYRFVHLSLNDFTEQQVHDYLAKKGWTQAFPFWLPTRPLLLGYLASHDLLKQVVTVDVVGLDPAAGWDMLLKRICDRESEIEVGLDGDTIRRLIERLASKSRKDLDGVGPIQADEMLATFQEVCGYPPDDRSAVLIQRLPGLGIPNSEDGSRSFIDLSLADAAKAGDVVRFIESPFAMDMTSASDWQSTLRGLGILVAAHQCSSRNINSAKISTAIQYAAKKHELYALCADVVQVAQELNCPYQNERVFIKGVFIPEYSCGDNDDDFSRIEYQDCVFQSIDIAPDAQIDLLPNFVRCHFGTVDGRISEADMPSNKFSDCSYGAFVSGASTSSAILSLDLPLGVRVLLVTLRKLYLQSGAGRRTSGLYRGLDQRAKSLVPGVLQLLKREDMVIETRSGGQPLWLPIRSQSGRVKRLISAPSSSDDKLISESYSIS